MMGVRAGLNGGIRWVSALAGLCGCWCAEGADRAPTGEQVRLVAERAAVTAGAPFTLAVELRTRPGWHTYWMNPGDSGLAPALRWQLPDGVRLTGVAFPVPERIEEEGMVSFGYTDRVWLLADFATEKDRAFAEPIEVGVSVDWMVCLDTCVPLKGSDTLRLTVGGAAADGEKAAVADPEFGRWRARTPQPANGWGVQAQITRRGLALRIRPAAGAGLAADAWKRARFYPLRRGGLDLVAPQRWRADGAAWEAILRNGPEPHKAGESLEGVLVFEPEPGDRDAVPRAWSLRATVKGRP